MNQASVLTPLEDPASRSNIVTAKIREAILAGDLKPGETLIERRLAQLLGVSKTPVREALIVLASSGLVVSSPKRGVSVRELNAVDVKQIYELRLLLEPWAAARTTERASAPVVKRIRTALNDCEKLHESEHDDQLDNARSRMLSLANRAFHRELYEGCGNGLVVRRLNELQDLTALSILSVLWKQWPTWRAEFTEHRRIYEMVEAGDHEAVRQNVAEHIQNSVNRLSDSPFD